MIYTAEIPLKMPSLNEYIRACRSNKYAAAKMKSGLESAIAVFLTDIPKITQPVRIRFIWTEGNKKRDLDNICFAKKFILDALVKYGYLKDDNRRIVTAFSDEFEYADDFKVLIELEEVTDDREDAG